MAEATLLKRHANKLASQTLAGVSAIGLAAGGCVEIRVPNPAARIIAFGDSTTASPSTRDYVDALSERLGRPAEELANEGEGGETTDEGSARLRELIALGLYPNAETILFWEGANDLTQFLRRQDPLLSLNPDAEDYPLTSELLERLDETASNIDDAVVAAQAAGWDVLVATYFDLRQDVSACEAVPLGVLFPEQAANANVYIRLLNERLRAVVMSRGATLVDVATLNEALLGNPSNYFDCNHLSAAGNAIVADLFADVLSPGSE